jgi:hypothetical protein
MPYKDKEKRKERDRNRKLTPEQKERKTERDRTRLQLLTPERSEIKKGCDRERRLKNKFGITIEDYNQMFEYQDGRCGICGKHQSELSNPLSVDHCHKTGKVRGLLCPKCNSGIGMLGDDLYGITLAMEYLQEVA